MRRVACRSLLIVVALASVAACAADATRPAAGPPVAPLPPAAPPLPAGAVAYDRSSPSMYADGSSFILRPDGGFDLTYEMGQLGYPGTYASTASSLAFAFKDSDTAGAWLAEGTIQGDSLHVEFNLVMSMADFESGWYVRRK